MQIDLTAEQIKALIYIIGLSDPMTLRKKNDVGEYLPKAEMEDVCSQIHPLFNMFNDLGAQAGAGA